MGATKLRDGVEVLTEVDREVGVVPWRVTLRAYLGRLIAAYLAAPADSEIEDALDHEIARVAELLDVSASDEIQAASGGHLRSDDVQDALDAARAGS